MLSFSSGWYLRHRKSPYALHLGKCREYNEGRTPSAWHQSVLLYHVNKNKGCTKYVNGCRPISSARSHCVPVPDPLCTSPVPIVYQSRTHCVPVPVSLCTSPGPIVYQSRSRCVPVRSHCVPVRSHCVPVPVPLCTSPVPLCTSPGPIVYRSRSHCLPVTLCPGPIVYQSLFFRSRLYQFRYVPVPLCTSPVVY